jgi:hypothetical protein
MEWDFTPEDVRSGKADYSVAEFKEDLLEEINENLAEFKGNIEMLRVVIKKRIQDDVEKGIPPVDVVKNITSELLGV